MNELPFGLFAHTHQKKEAKGGKKFATTFSLSLMLSNKSKKTHKSLQTVQNRRSSLGAFNQIELRRK